jgi:endonuclease-8
MPEGDTIHYAARRIRPLLEGRIPEISHPHPRLRGERWPRKLADRAVTAVDAHGKHLFLRFAGGLAIHSHLRMTGSWGTYHPGEPWRRAARRAWLVLRTELGEVVQFDGPLLELVTQSRTRLDPRLATLGPDILAPELDEAGFLRRLRADDPTRTIGDALLDQRTIAGIGNLWKCEACFSAAIDPWRVTGGVSDDEALSLVRAIRPRMQQSALDGRQDAHRVVYAQVGRPCPRCGAAIRSAGQGDDNRTTYWCAECQR